jgi:hypothetical protein
VTVTYARFGAITVKISLPVTFALFEGRGNCGRRFANYKRLVLNYQKVVRSYQKSSDAVYPKIRTTKNLLYKKICWQKR